MKRDLYVLEKKEIIVLILLLTLVALLSFTLGIKMGKDLKKNELAVTETHEKGEELTAIEPEKNHEKPKTIKEKGLTEEAILEDQLVKAVEGETIDPVKSLKDNVRHEEHLPGSLPTEKKKAHDSHAAATPDMTVSPKPPVKNVPKTLPSETKGSMTHAAAGHDANEAALDEQSQPPVDPKESLIPDMDGIGKYTIQVGSHSVKEEARLQVEQLKKEGVPAFFLQVDIPNKGIWYRVGVGLFKTVREAKKYASRLQRNSSVNDYIVQKVE